MAGPSEGDRIYTEAEYLALEDASDDKHEFWYDRIVPIRGETTIGARAMAGASEKHVRITSEAITSLNIRLRGIGCHAGGSDVRVQLDGSNYAYPDVAV